MKKYVITFFAVVVTIIAMAAGTKVWMYSHSGNHKYLDLADFDSLSFVEPGFLEVSPVEKKIGKEGGRFTLDITANKPWTASSNDPAVILGTTQGTGNAKISCTAMPNAEEESYIAIITVTLEDNTYKQVLVAVGEDESKVKSISFKEKEYIIREDYMDLNLKKELVVVPEGILDTCKIVWKMNSGGLIAEMDGDYLRPKNYGAEKVTATIQGMSASCNITIQAVIDKKYTNAFFLLNQGNMGSNAATLDVYDYNHSDYYNDIYPICNHNKYMKLGDVGTDLQIYGSKMYDVINCSNRVVIMDATTAEYLGEVTVKNCRYIAFYDGKAYVTSYAGAFGSGEQLGSVAEIDTTTLALTGRICQVGYQPDGIAAVDGKLYVANSGGYRSPEYDNRLSVIDIASFTEIKKIELLPSMDRIAVSRDKKLYITSRGNYMEYPDHNPPLPYIPSTLVVFDPQTESIVKDFNLPASNICITGDSCYAIYTDYINETHYNIINTKTQSVVSENFIKDGSDTGIRIPYAIAVNPKNRDIIVCDATDFVSPGEIYYYGRDGILKWKHTTGDIPACIAFLHKEK